MHPPKRIPLFTPHNICFSAYLTRLNIFPHPAKSPLTSELFSTENFLEKRYSTEKKIQQLPHALIYSHFDTQIRTNPTSSSQLPSEWRKDWRKKINTQRGCVIGPRLLSDTVRRSENRHPGRKSDTQQRCKINRTKDTTGIISCYKVYFFHIFLSV